MDAAAEMRFPFTARISAFALIYVGEIFAYFQAFFTEATEGKHEYKK